MMIESSGNSGVDTRGRCAMLGANAMSGPPNLSVIVPCLDPGPHLPGALASIWEQRWAGPELIVVDRGCRVDTSHWLGENRARINSLLAAPATGIYEALNQGIAAARGEWLLFFGARDRLVGDMVLSETLNWMKKTEAGVVAGEAASDDGRLHKFRSRVNPIAGEFVPASATFYRRSLFAENGAFDPALGVMAGYEFNLRLWKNRVRFKPIPLRIAACAAGERFSWQAAGDEIRARHRYYAAWRCWPWDFLSLLRAARPARRRLRTVTANTA